MSTLGGVRLLASIDEIDADWLTDAMRASGTLAGDARVAIGPATPVGDPAFAGALYRMTLTGPPGLPDSAIVKLPVAGALRPVLDVLGAYSRELAFYRDIAPIAPVRHPRVLVALDDPDTTDFVLVLEDLAPLRSIDPVQGLTLEQAERTIDAIARLHAWSWEQPLLTQHEATFPPINSPAGTTVINMFRQAHAATWPLVLNVAGDAIEPSVRDFGARLPNLVPAIVEEIASPRALVHGDLSGANLFFDASGEPILIDFQTVTQECGPREVAHLIGLSVPTALRRANEEALVRRYWTQLRLHGVTDYPWERAWHQYRLGLAYTLMLPVLVAARWAELPSDARLTLRTYLERITAAIADHDAAGLVADTIR